MRTRWQAAGLEGPRGDGDVVEEAEAHRAVRLGVVPGRPQEREAVGQAPVRDRGGEVDEPSGGEPRRERRVAAGVGVGIELLEILAGRCVDGGDVRRRVDALELRVRGLAGGDAPAARGKPLLLEPPPDRREASRVLRVIVGRAVREEPLVVDEPGGHRRSRAARSASGSDTGAWQAKPVQT